MKELEKIKRRINRNIKVLPQDVARLILEEHAEIKKRLNHGNKIIIRLITGGFWSQSLDAMVMRKLGIQAGWIKGE